jgi:hypothetical protein
LLDPSKTLLYVHIFNNDITHVSYKTTSHFKKDDEKTNVVIASFTTAIARLKVYSVLEMLGERILYYDTDSVIFVSKPGLPDPPLSDFLGDLTDELSCKEVGCTIGNQCQGHYIETFVCTGPKSYAYLTNNTFMVSKVKIFSLNHKNSQVINFNVMKDIVSHDVDSVTVHNPINISRDKYKMNVYNREKFKKFQMVYTKWVIQPDGFNTLLYGY